MGMTVSQQRRAAAVLERAAPGDMATTRWTWLRYPDFWIAVALAAVLRLWALDSSIFVYDQATLMTLAREAVQLHVLPVTSINMSIGILQPPLSIYLLMPFALFGTNPLPAIVAIALWNVLGVALCYIFALRYFGRRVAAVGALLFAAGPTAVLYSRFVWQSNCLPPLYTLYAMALYALCIRGRRGMLVAAVLLLTLGALIHPTALLLAPALVAAVLLAPRRPQWREYALSAVLIAALVLPTLVWEGVSNGSDVHQLAKYAALHAKVDPEIFFRLFQALGAPVLPPTSTIPHVAPRSLGAAVHLLIALVTDPVLGASSPFAALGGLYVALALVSLVLFAAGWLTVTWRIFMPVQRLAKERPGRLADRVRTVVGELAVDATWRTNVLLWLLVTMPLALLLRHSSSIYPHYLIVLYPGAFLTMALGVLALAEAAVRLAGRLRLRAPHPTWLALAVVAALAIGQSAQSLLYTYSISSGQFDAQAAGYGYPLGALQQADARLTQLQRQAGARWVYIAEGSWVSTAMDYILVREHPDRTGFLDTCLVLPPENTGPALIVAAVGSRDAQTLARLPNAALLSTVPMAGNTPLAVYRVAGGAPISLPGETALAPVTFQDPNGQGVQLQAVQRDGNLMRLRWTALRSTPAGATTSSLRVIAFDIDTTGQIRALRGFRDCAPTRWQTGDSVFTWLSASSPGNGVPGAAPAPVLIQAQENVTGFAMPTFGPIRLLSSLMVTASWRGLTPYLPGDQSHMGERVADGGVVLG